MVSVEWNGIGLNYRLAELLAKQRSQIQTKLRTVQDQIASLKQQIQKLEGGILKEYKLDIVKITDRKLQTEYDRQSNRNWEGLTQQKMIEHEQSFQVTGDKFISGRKADKVKNKEAENPDHLKTQAKPGGHTRLVSF